MERAPPKTAASRSVRQAKDPKDFGGDYDKIREELQKGDGWGSGYSMASVLNTVSNNSFGKAGKGIYKSIMDNVEGRRRALSNVRTDRNESKRQAAQHFGITEMAVLGDYWRERGHSEQEADELVEQTAVVAYACRERSRRSLVEYAEATEVLASVLVCSPRTAAAMALKCPDVLTQSMSRTMMLMVWFKEVLPSADISAMLQNEPSLLTMSTETQDRALSNLELLNRNLEGAPIDEMIQDDPWLITGSQELLHEAVVKVRELWPEALVSKEALSASEPKHLVLALRSMVGLPSKM